MVGDMSSRPERSSRAVRALRARLVALGLVAGAGALFASTLGVQQGCAEKAPAPSAQPPIVVGVSFGLTGGLEAFAAPLRNAVRVAENQINASGGVLGRPLVFDIVDDKSDEESFVEGVANDFVKKKVVAVIGPIGSQQVVRTQKILADAKIIQISPSATSTDLSTIQDANDRWLFRTTPADDFQGAAVMLFAQRTPNGLGKDAGAPAVDGGAPATCSKLAIVNIDNSYGNSMADVIEKNFPKRTGKPILTRKKVAVKLEASYQDVASQVAALSPECLALIAYDDVAAQFVRDFKADPKYAALAQNGFFFIGTDGVYTDGFLERGRVNPSDPTSQNVAEGVYGTNPDTQPGTPEYNQFKTLYAASFPLKDLTDAPAFTANTFDAAILIALAIQQAGTTDGPAVRDALFKVATPPGKPVTPAALLDAFQLIQQKEEIDYKGASGSVDFEGNGNVKSGFIVWEAYRDPAKKTVGYRTKGRFALDELLDQLK
jgi:ABC-type branched-subunit amino acid transport system substrate-binding protein